MANKFFLNTGNTDWFTPSNWSLTDGGATINAVPAAADEVFLTANSGNCSVNALAQMRGINCTGYAGTLTLTDTGILDLRSTDMYLSPTMQVAGSGIFRLTSLFNVQTFGLFLPHVEVAYNGAYFTLLDTMNAGDITMINATRGFEWRGSYGFVTGKFTGSAFNVSLSSGVTYKVGDFVYTGRSVHPSVKAITAGTKAILIVTGTANIVITDFTDIDASGGRTLYTLNGVVTNSDNINTYTETAPLVTTTSAIICT